MRKEILQDLRHHISGTFYDTPKKVNFLRILRSFLTPEFRVILAYRIDNWLYKKKFKFFAFYMHQRHKRKYSCDISPSAKIGLGLRIVHAFDIVVGPQAIIGDHCVLYNGVTLGNRKGSHNNGMPILGNNVLVGTGAKLLGGIEIGDNVKIGANSVVLQSFHSGSVGGIPGTNLKNAKKKI